MRVGEELCAFPPAKPTTPPRLTVVQLRRVRRKRRCWESTTCRVGCSYNSRLGIYTTQGDLPVLLQLLVSLYNSALWGCLIDGNYTRRKMALKESTPVKSARVGRTQRKCRSCRDERFFRGGFTCVCTSKMHLAMTRRGRKPVVVQYEDEEPIEKTGVEKRKSECGGRGADGSGDDDLKDEDYWVDGLEGKAAVRAFRSVHPLLVGLHGKPVRKTAGNRGGRKKTVLEALVSVILSQNTSDRNSRTAYKGLKARFKDMDEVRRSDAKDIEEAIHKGGLAKTKSQRIKDLLQQVHEERGETSLEFLREAPTEELKDYLQRFKGVGPKTIACLLLFTLGRDDIPVDTHVARVSKRLGWVKHNYTREATYQHLNEIMPDELKYDLHVLLISHGRTICQARRPACGKCPLKQDCLHHQRTTTLSEGEAAGKHKEANNNKE
ncbi:HhH-GPD family base excision DNA repair protein [Balamuthia mandrillaris]